MTPFSRYLGINYSGAKGIDRPQQARISVIRRSLSASEHDGLAATGLGDAVAVFTFRRPHHRPCEALVKSQAIDYMRLLGEARLAL